MSTEELFYNHETVGLMLLDYSLAIIYKQDFGESIFSK